MFHMCQNRRWSVLFLVAALFAGAILHEVRGDSITIIYSGNLDGELEPCGCTPDGNMGGIKRQVTIVDNAREKNRDIVLLSSGGLISSYTANERLTAEYILKGFQQLNYDAIGVQWSDLAYGKDFLATAPLAWVSSNWPSTVSHLHRTVIRGEKKLAVFSWLEGNPQVAGMESDVHPAVETGELTKMLRQAKDEKALTVLMSPLSEHDSKAKFNLTLVDILIIKSAYEEFGEPRRLGNDTLILEPGSRGMRLGKVELDINAHGKIVSFRHEVIPMPSAVPDAARMTTWYDDYNARVKENYLKSVELRKSQRDGALDYVGEQECKTCHAAQHEIWSRTRHADAFDALREVNKAFDPACIVCHTVGFNKKGGYIDDLVTDYLRNVQCESCHGSGRVHVTMNGKAPLGHSDWNKEKICHQCHVPKHSPKFNINEYWPKVAH